MIFYNRPEKYILFIKKFLNYIKHRKLTSAIKNIKNYLVNLKNLYKINLGRSFNCETNNLIMNYSLNIKIKIYLLQYHH